MRNSLPWKEPDEIPHESSLEPLPTTSTPKGQSSTRNQKFLTVVPLVNLPKSCSRVPAAMTLVSEGSMDEDVAKDDVCFNNDFDFGSVFYGQH